MGGIALPIFEFSVLGHGLRVPAGSIAPRGCLTPVVALTSIYIPGVLLKVLRHGCSVERIEPVDIISTPGQS